MGGYGLTGLLLLSWKGNDLSDSDKSREAGVSNRWVHLRRICDHLRELSLFSVRWSHSNCEI